MFVGYDSRVRLVIIDNIDKICAAPCEGGVLKI